MHLHNMVDVKQWDIRDVGVGRGEACDGQTNNIEKMNLNF